MRFNYDNLKMKSGVFYDIQKKDWFYHNVYHCGYIFLNTRKNTSLLEEVFEMCEEITFEETIELKGEVYRVIGFDTIHSYNTEYDKTYNGTEDKIFAIFDKWDKLLKENNV